MTKSDTGKPRSTVMLGGLNSCPITMKYLLEYFGGLQVPLGPVDIKDFVENFLHLEILSDIVDLPYIKAFIYYSPGVYFHIKSDRPISVEPGTIILNQDIEVDSPQGRFVLGHEAGHWIINRELADPVRPNYSCCKTFEMRTDYMDAEKISHYIDTDADAWSEIKADCIANAISSAIEAYKCDEEENRGIMAYLGDRKRFADKVYSIFPSVEKVSDRLMGVFTCQICGELDSYEYDELLQELRGQASDGYCEGLEQHEIHTSEGDIYVSFYDTCGAWDLMTEEEVKAAPESPLEDIELKM